MCHGKNMDSETDCTLYFVFYLSLNFLFRLSINLYFFLEFHFHKGESPWSSQLCWNRHVEILVLFRRKTAFLCYYY